MIKWMMATTKFVWDNRYGRTEAKNTRKALNKRKLRQKNDSTAAVEKGVMKEDLEFAREEVGWNEVETAQTREPAWTRTPKHEDTTSRPETEADPDRNADCTGGDGQICPGCLRRKEQGV